MAQSAAVQVSSGVDEETRSTKIKSPYFRKYTTYYCMMQNTDHV